MKEKQKLNIVMFNMSKYSDWQKGIANRNYHVLHSLARNNHINKIIAVDFLPFNFKRALKTYIGDQVLRDTQGTIIYGDLTSRCWQVSSKILVYSTIDTILNKSKIISELNRIITDQNMKNNLIIWNYNPLYIDYFDNQLNQVLNIFDAVDDWLNHSSYKKFQNILKNNYETIKRKSNLIFTVSQSLKKELFENINKVHWLPNAVNLKHFQSETNIHPKLNNITNPIIGFLGILQDRLDTNILLKLAENNPGKSIVLAGPCWPNFPKKDFKKFKNIHFLGPINHREIPMLYNGFDVGIIPYKINKFIKSTDPMKFYEYLSAKLPIVSTNIPGLERFQGLIQIAKTPEEFDHLVNRALTENKEKLSEEKINLLSTNTWNYRISQMLKLIYEKL